MLTVVVVVVSNPVPHGNFMIVLDTLYHQRWRLQVLTILKVLGKGSSGKREKGNLQKELGCLYGPLHIWASFPDLL